VRHATLSLIVAVLLCLGTLPSFGQSTPGFDQSTPAMLAARIDALLEQRLQLEQVPVSPPADDEEFLRRATLDLTGRVPTPDEVRAFLNDRGPDKRAKLLDALFRGPAYGRRQADLWARRLFTRTTENDAVQVEPFVDWLAQEFHRETPWNALVSELLTATGPQRQNPAVTMFMGGQHTTLAPQEAANLVSKTFLGLRLECAQCHNHPFDVWTQRDYWGFAAFFKFTHFTNRFPDVPALPAGTKPGPSDYGVAEFSRLNKKHEVPDRALELPARVLQGQQSLQGTAVPPRVLVAQWLTAADNPWFAQATANRIWEQYFGRGLIHPADDLRADQTCTHPEILELLRAELVAHDFDTKFLARAICATRAYQRSSATRPGNETDEVLFSRTVPRVLAPEQLFDALAQLLGRDALDRRGRFEDARVKFLDFLKTEEEHDARAYRRGIPQTLRLLNDPLFQTALNNKVQTFATRPRDQQIEELYLLVLARRPLPRERELCLAQFARTPATAARTIFWALLHSSEFALNH